MKSSALDNGAREALTKVAFDQSERVEGSFLASDAAVIESRSLHDRVELLPLQLALEKYPWLEAKCFSLVPKDKDDKVAQVAARQQKLGYFLWVRAGEKITLPIQTCYLINSQAFTQLTHNIIIAEKESELHLISGCTTNAHITKGVHIGVTEYFLEEGATLTSTMIHSWGSEVEVYPRSAVQIGKNARFVSNYVALSPVKKIEMNPVAHVAEGGLGEFYSVIYAPKGSLIDIGSVAFLEGERARANIVSRAVSAGGKVIARGKITGQQPGGNGSMSCNGLMLEKGGEIHAIPELVADDPMLELSHEASVGMISRESLAYLMASGIDEEEAKRLIVEGFLDLRIPGLPPYLQRQIDELIRQTRSTSAL